MGMEPSADHIRGPDKTTPLSTACFSPSPTHFSFPPPSQMLGFLSQRARDSQLCPAPVLLTQLFSWWQQSGEGGRWFPSAPSLCSPGRVPWERCRGQGHTEATASVDLIAFP